MPETPNTSEQELGYLLPRLARWAVRDYLLGVTPTKEGAPEGYLSEARGVFVTIRTRDGRLRGCRGTIEPQHPNLVEETRSVAVSSAFRDTRFDPIQPEEMPHLHFEVSVLHPPEPVASQQELDPVRYGVIVEAPDGRRGVMLPEVEGLDTAAQQVEATLRKAGIQVGEPFNLSRFKVDQFIEPGTAAG